MHAMQATWLYAAGKQPYTIHTARSHVHKVYPQEYIINLVYLILLY